MKILELRVKNLLSFSEYGFNSENGLINFLDFNLIIGKNNSGKSNLLKIFKFLTGIFESNKPIIIIRDKRNNGTDYGQSTPILNKEINLDNWFYNQENDNNIEFSFLVSIEKDDDNLILSKIIKKQGAPDSGNPFLESYKKTLYPKLFKIYGNITSKKIRSGEFLNYIKLYKLEMVIDRKKKDGKLLIYDFNNLKVLNESCNDINEYNKKIRFTGVRDQAESLIKEIISLLKEKILFISSNRQVGKMQHDLPLKKGTIIETLNRIRDGRNKFEIKSFKIIREFLKDLILSEIMSNGEKDDFDFKFLPKVEKEEEVIPGMDELRISINNQILPLSHFGSGVEQLLCIITDIVSKGENTIVLIEEPEVHLHPDLQRKLIRFLSNHNNKWNNQYIISTHSSTFIDEFLKMKSKIYYSSIIIDKNIDEPRVYSLIEELNPNNIKDLLDDLNVKGSDILQANGIIWVEGPSDIIYLEKFIEVYCEEKKIGLDKKTYEIVNYGGNLLKYFDTDREIDFWVEENKERIDSLINLLKVNRNFAIIMDRDDFDNPSSKNIWKKEKKERIRELCKNSNNMSWLTKGCQIEDYLPKEIIEKYKIFDGEKLSKKYSLNKVSEAKKIVKDKDLNWNKLTKSLDLEERLGELIENINKWNK